MPTPLLTRAATKSSIAKLQSALSNAVRRGRKGEMEAQRSSSQRAVAGGSVLTNPTLKARPGLGDHARRLTGDLVHVWPDHRCVGREACTLVGAHVNPVTASGWAGAARFAYLGRGCSRSDLSTSSRQLGAAANRTDGRLWRNRAPSAWQWSVASSGRLVAARRTGSSAGRHRSYAAVRDGVAVSSYAAPSSRVFHVLVRPVVDAAMHLMSARTRSSQLPDKEA